MMAIFSTFLFLLCLLSSSIAAPVELGVQFDKRAGTLPTLTLPYGTYRASLYNPNGDVRLHHLRRVASSAC